MKEITLDVRGMSCGHCVNAIEGSVGELPGVRQVKADLQNAQVSVSYDAATSSPTAIKETIEEQGYDVA
ncbi:copper chaperone CopZ [Bhargavaea ginsengi]|uniref:copper chaperone CopZ n=1 Tax=Bhargavaea ginsengi TaxID=426757 RepID=UPI003C7161D8